MDVTEPSNNDIIILWLSLLHNVHMHNGLVVDCDQNKPFLLLYTMCMHWSLMVFSTFTFKRLTE